MPGPRACALIALAAVLATTVGIGLTLRTTPTASANPVTGFTQIDGGLFHTCGLLTSGGVKCWGLALDAGGDGSVDFGPTSADAPGMTSGITSIATGLYHTCAVTTSSTVKCIGKQYGTTAVAVPAFGTNVTQISAGWDDTCALKTTGGIACYFTDGTPLASTGLTSGIAEVANSNGFHTCVRMTNGTVKCWGFNEHGQIGDGTTTPRPTAVQVAGITNATQLSLGVFYSCALLSTGGVKCWGDGFGPSPVDLTGMTSGIAQISASVDHLCALTTSGGVLCRGLNTYGNLGDGFQCGTGACLTPVTASGLGSGVTFINTGHEHSCAILASTQARCWGFNGVGGVGDGTFARERPVPVVVAISTQKPTPTGTPCPGVCPTLTPTPTLAPSELDFFIGVDTDGDSVDNCRTYGIPPRTCNVQIGSQFDVRFYLRSLPNGVREYDAFAASMVFSGISFKNHHSITWRDCITPASHYKPAFVNFACATFGGLSSTATGLMGTASFTCSDSGNVHLVHSSTDTLLIDHNSQVHVEPSDHVDELTINCLDLPPTPTFTAGPSATPTWAAVGGVATETPRGGLPWWMLAGATAAAVIMAAIAVRKRES